MTVIGIDPGLSGAIARPMPDDTHDAWVDDEIERSRRG